MPKYINEKNDQELIKQWYRQAKECTPDTLDAFVRSLTTDYGHDYGTICHAAAAAAIAAASAVDNSPSGGITGFQAGAIMWQFVREWMYPGQTNPMRLVDFSTMLYPQYEADYRTISNATWEWLQQEAQEKLDQCGDDAVPEVTAHWQSIVDGKVPFEYGVRG